MLKIGRRIAVWGQTCSGKSTVASHIAQSIGAPHIELDAVFWQPGWVEMPTEEFRARVSSLLGKHTEGWVFDGNYSRVRDLILPHADTVIWLRPPFRFVFWWALKRAVIRCWTGEVLWGTNRESWREQFLSRESLLYYIITRWRRQPERIKLALEEIPHQATIIQLRSTQEINAFLDGLSQKGE
jgi:adenylate kinase family enzyme